jgi:hypothetical protein
MLPTPEKLKGIQIKGSESGNEIKFLASQL